MKMSLVLGYDKCNLPDVHIFFAFSRSSLTKRLFFPSDIFITCEFRVASRASSSFKLSINQSNKLSKTDFNWP